MHGYRDHVRFLRVVLGLLSLSIPGGTLALPPELWVVNEGSWEISIIDDIADTPATIETISLGGAPDPAPYGIAFSTLEAQPGAHAFVSQGHFVRVIEQATRAIVATCDVATWIGAAEVTLKGMDAARPERFEDPPGPRVTRSYLHVAANVRPTAADDVVPWFLVLDQFILTDIADPCRNAVVADGPLFPPGTGVVDAMEVHVLGSPAGERTQRAWYSFREPTDPPALSARLVTSGPALGSPWETLELVTIPAPAGGPSPDSVHPGAPHSRELPLLPVGSDGDLLRLDTQERCSLGDTPRAVAVAGPGLGSYTIWTAKLNPAGPPDLLQQSTWDLCSLEPPLAVGRNPVDVEILGRVEWHEVYVANHDSDEVSVVQASDPTTVIQIPLRDGGGDCVKCPRSLAVQETPISICRAVDLELELINEKTEILHSWNGVGCAGNPSFKLWCTCLAVDPADCPVDCPKHCSGGGGGRPGDIWCEVDVIAGSGNQGGTTTTSAGGEGETQRNLEPNDS